MDFIDVGWSAMREMILRRLGFEVNGIPKQHFNLFLKECEWRFNMGSPKLLLDDLKSILKQQS